MHTRRRKSSNAYRKVVDAELLEAVGKSVAVVGVGTETDLHSADVRLKATADARVNTLGAAPSALALPTNAHEHVACKFQGLGRGERAVEDRECRDVGCECQAPLTATIQGNKQAITRPRTLVTKKLLRVLLDDLDLLKRDHHLKGRKGEGEQLSHGADSPSATCRQNDVSAVRASRGSSVEMR